MTITTTVAQSTTPVTTTPVTLTSLETKSTHFVPIVRSTEPTETSTPELNLRSIISEDTTTKYATTLSENNNNASTFVTESSNSSTLQSISVLETNKLSTLSNAATESTTPGSSTTAFEVISGSKDVITKSLLYTTTIVPSTDATQQESENTTETFESAETGMKTVTRSSIIMKETTNILDINKYDLQTAAETSTARLQTDGKKYFPTSTDATDATSILETTEIVNKMMVEASKIHTPDSITDNNISKTTPSDRGTTTDHVSYRSSTLTEFSTNLSSSESNSSESVTTAKRVKPSNLEHNTTERSNDSAQSAEESLSTSDKFIDSLKNIIDSLIIKTASEETRKNAKGKTYQDDEMMLETIKTETSVNKSIDNDTKFKRNTPNSTIENTTIAPTKIYTEQSTQRSTNTVRHLKADIGTKTMLETSTLSSERMVSSTMNSSYDDMVNTTPATTTNNTTTIDVTIKGNSAESATVLMSTQNGDQTVSTLSEDKITKTGSHETNVSHDNSETKEPVTSEIIMRNKVVKEYESATQNILTDKTTSVQKQMTENLVMVSESQTNDSSKTKVFVDNTSTPNVLQDETTSQRSPEITSALPQTTFESSTPPSTVKPTSTESIKDNQTKPDQPIAQHDNRVTSGNNGTNHGTVLYPDLAPLLDVVRKFKESTDSSEKVSLKNYSNDQMKEFTTEVAVSKSTISNASKTNMQRTEDVMRDIVSALGVKNYDVKNSEKQASFKDLGVIGESLKEGLVDMVKSVNLIDGTNIVNPNSEKKTEAGSGTLAVTSNKDQRNLS